MLKDIRYLSFLGDDSELVEGEFLLLQGASFPIGFLLEGACFRFCLNVAFYAFSEKVFFSNYNVFAHYFGKQSCICTDCSVIKPREPLLQEGSLNSISLLLQFAVGSIRVSCSQPTKRDRGNRFEKILSLSHAHGGRKTSRVTPRLTVKVLPCLPAQVMGDRQKPCAITLHPS